MKYTTVQQNVSMPCWCGGTEEVFHTENEQGVVIKAYTFCKQCQTTYTFYEKESTNDVEQLDT